MANSAQQSVLISGIQLLSLIARIFIHDIEDSLAQLNI